MRFVFPLVIAFVTAPTVACAQVRLQTPAIDNYVNCLNAAISGRHIKKEREAIKFTCFGPSAQKLFDYLGSSGYGTSSWHFNIGTFRYRTPAPSNSSYADTCFQQIEDASGRSVTADFQCDIYLFVGPLLNQ
jgi:hypothetical protein